MRREAVQEERQRTKESEDNEVESTSNSHVDSHFDRLAGPNSIVPVQALNGTDSNGSGLPGVPVGLQNVALRGPTRIFNNSDQLAINNGGILSTIDSSIKEEGNYNLANHYDHSIRMHDVRQSSVMTPPAFDGKFRHAKECLKESIIDWTRNLKEFKSLLVNDRLQLLKSYWNELILIDIAYRSMLLIDTLRPGLVIWHDLKISEGEEAEKAGIKIMFERIIKEIVVKMKEMQVDQNELNLLKTIILFNPEAPSLKTSRPIEDMRNSAFDQLEKYCLQPHYFNSQPYRFGKLLLRLPALRSIGLKCNDNPRRKLIFVELDREQDIDAYLLSKIR